MPIAPHRRFWLRPLMVALVVAMVALATARPGLDAQEATDDGPAPVPQRVVTLYGGFNGFTFTGLDGSPPGSILDGLADPSALEAVFAFDASSGTFPVWRPGPAFLNTLTELDTHTAVFLRLARATTWTGPAPTQVAESVPLRSGFNLVAYLGPDSAAPIDVWGDAIDAMFWLDPATQTFASFRADAPPIVNSLRRLPRYGVLWVAASAGAVWHQPAYAGGPTITAVVPPVIPPDADQLILLGEHLGDAPSVTLAGSGIDTTVICDGHGVSLTLNGSLPSGTMDVGLTSDGVTTVASVDIGPLDEAALLLAIEATRGYVDQCVTDPEARADLQSAIDDIELQASAGDYAAAFDALDAFAAIANESTALSPADQEALQALSELQGAALAELDGGLLDRLGTLLGTIPFFGIPF